jgi:hypothetical protein
MAEHGTVAEVDAHPCFLTRVQGIGEGTEEAGAGGFPLGCGLAAALLSPALPLAQEIVPTCWKNGLMPQFTVLVCGPRSAGS